MQFDPQDPLQVQTLLDDLEVAGVSCFLKGNYSDAIKVFTYGLSVCEHVYAVDGHSHGQIRTAGMLLNLGITLGKAGEHSEAEPYLRRGLAKRASHLSPDKHVGCSPEASQGLDALAYSLIESGKIDQAIAILERRFREDRQAGTAAPVLHEGALDDLIARRERIMDKAEETMTRGPESKGDAAWSGEMAAMVSELEAIVESMRKIGSNNLEYGRTLRYLASVLFHFGVSAHPEKLVESEKTFRLAEATLKGLNEDENAKLDLKYGLLLPQLYPDKLDALEEAEKRFLRAISAFQKLDSPHRSLAEKALATVRKQINIATIGQVLDQHGAGSMRPGTGKKNPFHAAMIELLHRKIDQAFAEDPRKALADSLHRALDRFSKLMDLAEGGIQELTKAVEGMRDIQILLTAISMEPPEGRENPPPGSRAENLLKHSFRLLRYLFEEMEWPHKALSESEAIFQFLLRAAELHGKIYEAAGEEAGIGILDRVSLRPLAHEIRLYASRQHAMLAFPRWAVSKHPVRLNTVYYSGTGPGRALAESVCRDLGLEMLLADPSVATSAARQRFLQEAHVGVFDISGPGPAGAAAAYEFGIARCQGKPVILVASHRPIPFDFDVDPVILGEGNDREAVAAAIDQALFWTMPRPRTNSLSETIGHLAARYPLPQDNVLVEQNLKELIALGRDPDPVDIVTSIRSLAVVLDNPSPMVIHPPWPPAYPDGRARLFHIMPFSGEFDGVSEAVERICEEADFEYVRGDRQEAKDIIQSIWEGICKASHVLVDLTHFNLNVALELGISHTLGRPTQIMGAGETIKKLKEGFPMVATTRSISYKSHRDPDFKDGIEKFLHGAKDR
jgi:tetratricopeptide (TPR) repeat protein